MAGLRPSSPEVFAALSAQASPPTAPLPALQTVTASRAAPQGAGAAPLPLLLPASLATAPSQPQDTCGRLVLSLAGSTVAVASSCPGSDFVGEVC